MNRFANIFWHYYAGPLIGVRQRLWPSEKSFGRCLQSLALLLYAFQWGILLSNQLPRLAEVGMALILLSPQWGYVLPIPHPVFEFRGYGMAAGMACVLASVLGFVGVVLVSSVWAWRRHVRLEIVTSPLSFWERAQEEHHGT